MNISNRIDEAQHNRALSLGRQATPMIMKKILLPLFASLSLCFCTFAADYPAGSINLANATAQQVLPIFKEISGLELVVDSRVKTLRVSITFLSPEAKSKAELIALIETTLREQGGIVITRLDDKKASVTYNDALPIKKTKG